MQTSDINNADPMKYAAITIKIPPTIGLKDCCFLPYMKYPTPTEPHTNEANRKLALNISGSECHQMRGS